MTDGTAQAQRSQNCQLGDAAALPTGPDNKSPLRILLVLPAGARVRVTREMPQVPRRAMLRFSVLPLTTVAGLTPACHTVQIVDENVEPLNFDTPCDLVGISFMTALAPRAYAIAREFRNRGKMVVGGGYHPTLCPEDALPHFDALVIGDAEGSWERLLTDVQHGRLQRVYRYSGSSQGNWPSDMLRKAAPRRDLLERTAKHYATINAVQAGRGCRHACQYCSVTAFHQQKYRHRSLEDVLDEIRSLEGDLIFVDDNIIADRDYAMKLFQAMAPLRKRWVSQSSILIADDPELLRAAKTAGCQGLFIGLETVSDANLAAVNKRFNQAAGYVERLRQIRSTGIGVIAGIIVGLDGDGASVFQDTLRFLERAQIDALQLNILTPLPGTPLYLEMAKAGRISDPDWSNYDYRHVVFRPLRLSQEELQAGADWLYAQFYRLDRVCWRFVRGMFTLGIIPAYLSLRLGLTYRYDNQREGISGWNPARPLKQAGPVKRGWHLPEGFYRFRPGFWV